jgi:hypothetical protein
MLHYLLNMQNKNQDNTSVPMAREESQYIFESYVLSVPAGNAFLDDADEVKRYARKTIKHALGDEVEVSRVVVKKPGLFKKSFTKILSKEPKANLVVVTKF